MVVDLVGEIVLNEKVSNKDIYLLKVKGEYAINVQPGQFAMIKILDGLDPFLRRPMSIYSVEDNSYLFLYQVVGRGTEILKRKVKGDKINFLLPLGNSFPPLNKNEKVLLVGGGVGIAPLNFIVNYYKRKIEFYSYVGFSSFVEEKIYENFKFYSKEFLITTEDGSIGLKGKVLDFLPKDLERFDKIIACGPRIMLKKLWDKVQKKDKVYFSLEERMGCGIGLCLSCMVKGKNKVLHICKDGPIFSGVEVCFDE